MQQQNNDGLVRLGILALPIAGLLALVSHIFSVNVPDTSVDPGGAAQAVSATSYFVVQFFGAIGALTLLIFGSVALFACLVRTREGRLAPLAMVSSVLGSALLLTAFGVITYALPAVGKAYLAGQHDVLTVGDAFFSGPLGVVFVLISLLYSAAAILFGIAIWRSGTLPKWAGVLYAIHGPLIAGPLPTIVALIGSAVLLLSGLWIASSVLRQPSTRMEEATTQPRAL